MNIRLLLLPLSGLFWLVATLRRFIYQKFTTPLRLPGMTISIGNISVGGTGKSPITISLAQYLTARGHKPAVLTRGYRSGLASDESTAFLNGQILMPAQRSTEFFADEARMQAATVEGLPVIVGQNRCAAAQRYLAEHTAPSHWILDDGLQHLKIHRDIDLVCLDAAKPYADHLLLPAGSLREPTSQLSRASALIFTRYKPDYDAIIQNTLKRFPLPHLLVPFTVGTPYHVAGPHLFTLHGQPIRALTAIADAQQFFQSLLGLGLDISETVALGDHQTFTPAHLNGKRRELTTIVTTAKDYWRDPAIFNDWGGSVYVAPLKTDITDESWDRLFAAIEHRRTASIPQTKKNRS